MKSSDIAVEFSKKLTPKKDYVKKQTKINKFITKTIIEIKTDSAMQNFNREKGYYALLDIPFDPIKQSLQKKVIETELTKLMLEVIEKCNISKLNSVLVVGLGNPKMTADSFGSKVIEKVLTTRHAKLSGMNDNSICSISKINCNVFGATGLESYDIVKGIVDSINPNLVILIDTLVASSYKRLCSNIQIANVGIVPGSGVDNARKELSSKTLGTNVITIGIPFVVYAQDLVEEELNKLYKKNDELPNINLKNISNLIIMPREIDDQLKFCSSIVANAINSSLNKDLSTSDIETFFI